MSEEQLKAFLEAVKADAELQQKLQGVTDPDAVAGIAKEAGFSISADDLKKADLKKADLKKAMNQSDVVELSEEELEGVAGGIYTATAQIIRDCNRRHPNYDPIFFVRDGAG